MSRAGSERAARSRPPVTVTATGDIFVAAIEEDEVQLLVDRVRGLLPAAEFVYGNLEQAVGAHGFAQPKKALTGDLRVLDRLRAMGFTTLCVSNNHFFDLGPEAASAAVQAIRACGMAPVGFGQNLEEAAAPVVMESAGGLRLAIIAFFCAPAAREALGLEEARALPGRPGVAAIRGYDVIGPRFSEGLLLPESSDVEVFRGAIGAARDQADVVICTFHWHWWWRWHSGQHAVSGKTSERQRANEGMRWLAGEAVRLGADCVVAHGSHMPGGVGFIDGRPVLYSLGNLIFQLRAAGRARPQFRGSPSMAADAESSRWDDPAAQSSLVAHLILAPGSAAVKLRPIGIGVRNDGAPFALDRRGCRTMLEDVRRLSDGLGAALKFESDSEDTIVATPS